MNAPQATQCPPESVLSQFGLGKLDATSAETVSRHIETCADCRQRVASVSGDSFVGRIRQAGGPAQPAARRERTYVPGESLANAANSTDGAEDGLPRPSNPSRAPTSRDGPGSPSSVNAPPELENHPDYELIKELGQGGMGTVYLAKNRMMDRPEVLKVISKELLSRPGALERFQQEIRSAAKLGHTNIVAAYSVLRPGDLLVFAMEYVKGQDLSEVVKARGPLPVTNAAFYIHQVANGLQHAFEKGMVHRDIKPNNLMLAIEGKKHVVKILDFGLAKATSEKNADGGLTKSGQMLGTPDYVAPEQTLDAHQADIRADVYSLGCTLYFLLSGGPPFQEQSLYAILEAHHKREPKPLNLMRPDVPLELAMVVSKMMAKDPAKRYQTPAEVAKALAPFFKPGQSAAPPPAEKPTRQEEYPQYTMETAPGPRPTAPPPMVDPPPPVPVPVASRSAGIAPIPVQAVPQSRDDFSVSINVKRPEIRRRSRWSSLPPWQRWTALGGAAAAVLLGIVLLVRTPRGTVEIELSDPDAKVTVAVDGNRIDIAGLDEPLSLEVGEHEYTVKGHGFETRTKRFQVTRGTNAPLTISLVPRPVLQETTKDLPNTTDGFLPLFNGKDLTGWKTHPSRQGLWRVENGVLIGSGPATSYLFSERGNYTNFHLHVEARINEGGDSGVIGRSTFSSDVSVDGYEAQINSTASDKNKTGSLYKRTGEVYAVLSAPVGAREWFTLDLVAIDNRITVKVNGQTTADYTDRDRSYPLGHIALQQHDPQTVVEFRKIEIKELQSLAQGRPAMAPPDAQEFSGHWYKFYEAQLTWKVARDRCQALGGHLVVIDSLEENTFVGALVEKRAWQNAWIGATDEAEEGKWRDVDGKLLSFTNWSPLGNQPNNKSNEEHYALISNRTIAGTAIAWRWSDQPNESKQHQPGFICEWEAVAAATSLPHPAASSLAPPAPTAALTAAGFVGLLNGRDLDDWPIAKRGSLKFDGEAVRLGKDDFLVTKRSDFKEFDLRLELSAAKGTEAYAVVFHQGSSGQSAAITAGIFDDGTSIVAGNQRINLARLATSNAGSSVREHLRLHLPTSAGAGEAKEGRKQKTYDEFFKLRLANWNEVNFGIWIDGVCVSSVHHPAWPTDGQNANALGIVVRDGALTIRKIDVWQGP